MGMLYLVTTTRGQVSRVRPGPRKEDLPCASVSQWWLGSPIFRVPYTNTSVSRPESLILPLSHVTHIGRVWVVEPTSIWLSKTRKQV